MITKSREFIDRLTTDDGSLTAAGKGLAWAVFALVLLAVIAGLAGFGLAVAAITLLLMLGLGLGVLAYAAKTHSS